MSASAPDPVTLEVVRNALYAIAEEMSVIVMRSARSPLLKEAGDLSSALTDARGRIDRPGARHPDAHGRDGLHGEGVARAHPGGAHARRRRVVPQPARGGRQPSAGRQGGAARLLRGAPGGLRREPRPLGGHRRRGARQLRALGHRELPGRACASRRCGSSRRRGRSARPSTSSWRTCAAARSARAISSPSTRRTMSRRAGCRAVRALRRRDDRGPASSASTPSPRPGCARRSGRCPTACGKARTGSTTTASTTGPSASTSASTSAGDRATFDFSGSDRRSRGPVNTTYFITCSSVYYAMKALAAPDVPPNEGCYRPLEVIVPRGSVLNCDPDRPVVGGNHETSQRVVDAIMKALAPVLPDRVIGGRPRHGRAAHLRRAAARRPLDCALRGARGRRGRDRVQGRRRRGARAHVERHEHAGRGDRGRVPGPRGGAGAPARLGRGRRAPGRPRLSPRVPRDRRARDDDQHDRAARRAALWPGARRRRRAVSHHAEPGHGAARAT